MAKKDALIELWGHNAKSAGFICVPNLLIRHLSGLGITPGEFSVLFLLLTYRSSGQYQASPSKETVAECLGMSKDTVRRHIKSLEEKGYVEREQRPREHNRNESNIYHFEGLTQAIKKRAAAHLVEQENSKRVGRRANTKLRTMETKDLVVSEKDFAKLGQKGSEEITDLP